MKRLLITLGIILAATTCTQAQQWLPGGQGVPIVCAYSSSPPTIASGGFIYAQCNANGNSVIDTGTSGNLINAINNAPNVNVGSTPTALNGQTIGTITAADVVNVPLSHTVTSALAASLVVNAGAGHLGAYNCTAITGGAAGYCMVINATSAPTTGSTIAPLDVCQFDTTTKGCSLTRLPNSIAYSTGITILVSTNASPFTFTSGTDTAFIEADWY